MKNIVCPECKTENEQQYKYCKNCGKQLIADSGEGTNQKSSTYTQNETNYAKGVFVENIGSVKTEDVETYIGKKAVTILPKLNKMEFTGSKISWCWPVAVLSYFFGPLGAAIWFFYRKMYKAALILVAIGVVLTAGITFLSGDVAALEETLTTQIESGAFDINALLEIIDSEETARSMIASSIENVVSLATMIVCGLFAYNIYKNDIVKKINQYKLRDVDPRYYRMGLATIGGTSGGMAFLGVVIMSLAQEVCTTISMLVL